MPVTPTYPGVYIEEIPSGVRTITGVATSITAFLGRTRQGLVNNPIRIQSFADFERAFGGLWIESSMSYAVQQYFLNGGTDAIIVRIVGAGATKGSVTVGNLTLEAASEGNWCKGYVATVDYNTRPLEDGEQPDELFNLSIGKKIDDNNTLTLEIFRNLSTNPNASRYFATVLEHESSLVNVSEDVPLPTTRPSASSSDFTVGENGRIPTYTDYLGNQAEQTGLYALEQADLFNLLCLPPAERGKPVADDDGGKALLAAALAYCKKRRAMVIIDPPSTKNVMSEVKAKIDALNLSPKESGIIYYPQIKMADALKENRIQEFPACGAIAGIFARTDVQRGVWKAPAGIDATIVGATELTYKMTDGENGQLNPFGINCLRFFPVYGNVVWGARTLAGADALASEWKYVPVRRLALFLEESLYRGTKWVVFEPNDEPLWAQIRLNIGAFMNNLFRQGAFQGSSPGEAYFVKCDKETTTQNDINLGIVNIIVGYAPLKPAEFVIIKFQQIAGQIAT
jgi:phage tail sheath protein FI